MTKSTMTDIFLSVDVGSSQTKIIYKLKNSSQLNYLVMSPEVEEIPYTKLDTYMQRQGWIGNPSPEQQLWVIWQNRMVILGEFASYFDPIDRIKELKYENALWKVLGVIGVILEKSKIKITAKKSLKVKLALLLPWNEYNDRNRFEQQLRIMLSKFQVRKINLQVELEYFLCVPEGGGLATARTRNLGTQWLRSKRLGVLVFGHRNTTALYFDRGQLKSGDSPLLGFSNMLDMVISMTSGLDRKGILNAILKTRYDFIDQIYDPDRSNTCRPKWSQCPPIKALATAKDSSLRMAEIQDISNAITTATNEYWYKLERWISSFFSTEIDEVIIGGGAAYHIERDLEIFFNCKPIFKTDSNTNQRIKTNQYSTRDYNKPQVSIIWGSDIQHQILKAFNLESKDKDCISVRLVDCFGLFYSLYKSQ